MIKVFYIFADLKYLLTARPQDPIMAIPIFARMAGLSNQNLPGGRIPRRVGLEGWPIPPSPGKIEEFFYF